MAALRPILRAIDVSEGVRLLGVSGSNLVAPAQQLNLLADTEAPLRAAGAIDQIRERFGPAAIGPASAVGPSPDGRTMGSTWSARVLANGALTCPPRITIRRTR